MIRRQRAWPVLLLVLPLAASCGGRQQRVTIEPEVEPVVRAAGPKAVAADEGAGGMEAPGDDSEFVLSRQPPARERADNGPLLLVHTGDAWWGFRASFLNIPDKQARDRDSRISHRQAPQSFWDGQTALEAVSLWSSLCNECHGGRRKVEDSLNMPAPPPGWGQGEGLFFGKRRPYAELFAIVYNGGPMREGKRSEMPPWRGKIAREQIWALLYFLEYQSGGIEAPFPPSLQPRQSEKIKNVLQ